MKCTLLLLFLLFLPVVNSASPAFASPDSADTSKVYRVELKDGSSFIGALESETADSLRIRLASGSRLTVARSSVTDVEELKGNLVNGRYVKSDPNRSRLFFAPTARPVAAGSGYFAVYELFFPFFAVGIADVVTLAGGISVFPGATSQAYYLGPKITIPLHSETFSVAVGGHYMNAFSNNETGLGIVYGVTTIGSRTAALTAGIGYGYFEDEFSDNPLLLLGGEVQISGSVKLISENWIPVNADVAVLSFGVRFFGENLSADFGLYYAATGESTEGFPFLPWIGFSYAFGK